MAVATVSALCKNGGLFKVFYKVGKVRLEALKDHKKLMETEGKNGGVAPVRNFTETLNREVVEGGGR